MIKNILKVMVAVVAAISFASCASMKETAPVMGMSAPVIKADVTADLDLANAKPVEATVTMERVLCFKSYSDKAMLENSVCYKGLDELKSKALYKAKKEAGVDVILQPEFIIEKHAWFFRAVTSCKVTVKGWGVKIKGFK